MKRAILTLIFTLILAMGLTAWGRDSQIRRQSETAFPALTETRSPSAMPDSGTALRAPLF